MNTYMASKQTVQHNWYVVDANGLTLGRLATQVATLLRGKHKAIYTPNCDCEITLSLSTLIRLN